MPYNNIPSLAKIKKMKGVEGPFLSILIIFLTWLYFTNYKSSNWFCNDLFMTCSNFKQKTFLIDFSSKIHETCPSITCTHKRFRIKILHILKMFLIAKHGLLGFFFERSSSFEETKTLFIVKIILKISIMSRKLTPRVHFTPTSTLILALKVH